MFSEAAPRRHYCHCGGDAGRAVALAGNCLFHASFGRHGYPRRQDAFRAEMLLHCGSICLATGVEAVAHERLSSPAFDPLSGFETQRLRVNQRYLQNTLEQILVFTAGLFGLAAYCPDGSAMRAVLATSVVWILARFAFWIGYHRSAAMRGLGAPGMALSMIVLLYVAGRIGYEVGGFVAAAVPVMIFIAIEIFLFRSTRPLPPP
ncbi:MAG TPA: MAPEG family protein [Stellaceae bacterium]|nr:MAPEG family protein [Stellaceae bacterium]